jgi:hypothetical protein
MAKKPITKERLKRKREITKAIRTAEKSGAYEAAEHAASQINLDTCRFAGIVRRAVLKKNPSNKLARHLEKCDECWTILWWRIGEGLKPSADRVYAKGVSMPKLSGRKEFKL